MSVDSLVHPDNLVDRANKDLKDLRDPQDQLASVVRTDRGENRAKLESKVQEENPVNLEETVSSIFLSKI